LNQNEEDMTRTFARICALLLILFSTTALAAPNAEGSRVAPFSIEDQYGETHAIDGSVRAILLGRDMDAGDVLEDALAESGRELLLRTSTVYVADVSRMPSFIRRWIAEPKMRRRGYPMLLDRDGALTKDLPNEKGKATLIQLDQLEIVKVRYFESSADLRAALDELPSKAVGTIAP
jgi:hypothetical protein